LIERRTKRYSAFRATVNRLVAAECFDQKTLPAGQGFFEKDSETLPARCRIFAAVEHQYFMRPDL